LFPRPTKVIVHRPLTGLVIRTFVAATVPVESALPWAVTHSPTLSELDVVEAAVVIFVLGAMVTVIFVVPPVEPNRRAVITTVEPDTDDTAPDAMVPIFGRPDGTWPDGTLPDGKIVGPPVGRPPARSSQPLDGLIDNEAAVNDVADSDVPDGATAVTQVTTLTAAMVAATWWLNFVADDHVTATWPDCGFCTCIVVPSIAAMVPAAAGPRWPADGPLGPLLPATGDGVPGSAPPPLFDEPHAVKTTAAVSAATATPSAGRATDELIRTLLGSFAAQRIDG
jgi:hypothetical protein